MASNPKKLSDRDLDIYIDEAIRLFCDNGTPDSVAAELDWSLPDLLELMAHPSFKAKFNEVAPEVFDAITFSNQELSVLGARNYARQKLSSYMEEMHNLAMHAQNENIKFNALKACMDLAGATSSNVIEEVVELPKGFEDKIAQRLGEVLDQERTLPFQAKSKTSVKS
jgi:hypothetical protein